MESEDELRTEVAAIVDSANAWISSDDPAARYLDGFNKMFQLFDDTHKKNTELFDCCQAMNRELLRRARQVTGIMHETEVGKDSLSMLHEKFKNAIERQKEVHLAERQTKERVHELRQEFAELTEKAEQTCEGEAIEKVRFEAEQKAEIQNLTTENAELARDIENVQRQIRGYRWEIEKREKDIQALAAEVQRSQESGQNADRSQDDVKQGNEGMEKVAKNAESDIAQMRDTIDTLKQKKQAVIQKCDELTEVLKGEKAELATLVKDKKLIFHQTQLCTKKLMQVRGKIQKRQSQIAEFTRELTKRNEQLEQMKTTLEAVEQEAVLEAPRLDQALAKQEEVAAEKEKMKQRAAQMRTEVYEKSLSLTKSEGEKKMQTRIVTAEKYDLIQLQKVTREEESKTRQVIGQADTLMCQTNTTKKKMHEMRQSIMKVSDEIDVKTNDMKAASTSIALMHSDRDHYRAKNDEANESLNELKQKNEHQTTLIEKLRKERNMFRRQFEEANKEHEELEEQYSSLITSIEQMTDRIDELVKECTETHFRTTAIKSAIEALDEMKVRCNEGIKNTNRVIASLISEKQSMNRILAQTEKEKEAQTRELMILREDKEMICCQMSKKNALIETHRNQIVTDTQLLNASAKRFDDTMKQIETLKAELQQRQDKLDELERKREYVLELQFNSKRLREWLQIEQARIMALCYEGNTRRNVHRWTEIGAANPEYARQIRYYRNLNGRIMDADRKLKRLEKERDELKEKAEKMQEECDSALPMETVIQYMQRYTEDLMYKNALLDEMKRLIQENRNEQASTRKTCRTARLRLSQRREAIANLRTSNVQAQRAVTPSAFITEQTLYMDMSTQARGGGFRPRPPAEPKEDYVPRLNLAVAKAVQGPRPPNSQRYQRPNIGQLRKRYSRPVTARKW